MASDADEPQTPRQQAAFYIAFNRVCALGLAACLLAFFAFAPNQTAIIITSAGAAASVIAATVVSYTMAQLKLTYEVTVPSYALPYKLKRNTSPAMILGGCCGGFILCFLIIALRGSPRGSSASDILAAVGVMMLFFLPVPLICGLVVLYSWSYTDCTLHPSHLDYRYGKTRTQIPYARITQIDVDPYMGAKGSVTPSLTLYFVSAFSAGSASRSTALPASRYHDDFAEFQIDKGRGSNFPHDQEPPKTSPARAKEASSSLTLILKAYSPASCVALLQTLHSHAPQASFNRAASLMAHGEYPLTPGAMKD